MLRGRLKCGSTKLIWRWISNQELEDECLGRLLQAPPPISLLCFVNGACAVVESEVFLCSGNCCSWDFFLLCFCSPILSYLILLHTRVGILNLRIVDSPPPLQIPLDPYASPLAWSQTGQICGSLFQILCPNLEYPNEGWRISLASSLPIQIFLSWQDNDEAQLRGNLSKILCWKLHTTEEACGWPRMGWHCIRSY